MTVTVRTGRGGVCAPGRAAASRPAVTRNRSKHLPGSLGPNPGPAHCCVGAHARAPAPSSSSLAQAAGGRCGSEGLARAGEGGQLPQLRCGARGRLLDSPAGPAASWPQARGRAAATRVHRRKGNDRKPESGFTGMLRTHATVHSTVPARKPASGGRLNSDAIMYADRKASGA